MISVIIPLGPKDGYPEELVQQFLNLPNGSEIILAVLEDRELDFEVPENLIISRGSSGRASQMNAGVRDAKNDFLWFVHADSEFEQNTISNLSSCFKEDAGSLYYHDLVFMNDGPSMMNWNTRAVKWRSDFLKLPFGDQAFGISRNLFLQLGGYDETAPYGEDYLLIWKAHQEGVSVKSTGAKVWTSARKYQSGGWGKVTALHVFLTIKQGYPEFIKLLRKKFL